MSNERFFGKSGKLGRFGKSSRALIFMRRLIYFLILLFLYAVMCSGFFKKWQPILIIPLAISVAMREGETFGAVFGAACGLFLDTAAGKLFGFSSVWLMPCCMAAALLAAHLIKVNMINFLWINALTSALMAVTDYFFNYVLWGTRNSAYVLSGFVIPAYLSAAVLAPLMYFPVKAVSGKFSPKEAYSVNAGDEGEYEE